MRNLYGIGFLTGFAFGCLYFLVPGVIQSFQSPQNGVEPPRFEVIDQYRGCDVVRYDVPHMAKYEYFLDCKKSQ